MHKILGVRHSLNGIMFSIPKTILYVLVVLFSCAVEANAQANTGYKKQEIYAGQQIFLNRCFQSHSVNKDEVRFGPSLYGETNKSPHKKNVAQVRAIIKNWKNKMPAFKDTIPDKDLDDLLAYTRSL
jgi:mono/diheme cytochrome c family protein